MENKMLSFRTKKLFVSTLTMLLVLIAISGCSSTDSPTGPGSDPNGSIDAPSGLSGKYVTNGTDNTSANGVVFLTWNDNSNDEVSFNMERKQGYNNPWIQVGVTNSNVTYFTDSGLEFNTSYFYRVCASTPNGESRFSNVAEVKVLDLDYSPK